MLPRKLLLSPATGKAVNRWLAVAGVMLLYVIVLLIHVYLRGHADDVGRSTSSARGVESFLFHGLPPLWLQRWTPHLDMFDWLVAVLHTLPLVLLPALVLLVCVRNGARMAVQLIALQAALLLSADALFAAFPTRPPWMDTEVTRIVAKVYGHATAVDDNPFAAVPSLHVAVPMLYTLWFARQRDSLLKRLAPALGLWTLATAWGVTYGGEHYVVDLVAGVALAVAVYEAFALATPLLSRIMARVRTAVETAGLAPASRSTRSALPIDD